MDPVTLGVVASTIVAKAVGRACDDAVDVADGAVKRLLVWVRSRFAGRDELARVEEAPDSPSRLRALAEVIDRDVAADPAAEEELRGLVEQVGRSGSTVYRVGSVSADRGGIAAAHIEGGATAGYHPATGASGEDDDAGPRQGSETRG